MRTYAVIPAAGLSRRMGRPKLLLPLGGRTVLERVVMALRDGGVDDVLVVAGPGGAALVDMATAAGAHSLQLADDTPDMRATVERGLAWIEERYRPAAEDGWLLQPADHPTVRGDVVRAVLDAVHPEAAVVVPVHGGRRGHPVWMRWDGVAAIRALPAGAGLNAYVRAMAGRTVELPWADAEILRDLDTPADYEQLLADDAFAG